MTSAQGGVDALAQNRPLGRGVNIIGYDPLWRCRSEARVQDSRFRLIKDAGFSSVRINLHPFKSVGPAPDHAISPNWMETFDWAVGQALANDLMVILDVHEYNTMGDDPMGNKGGFLATWRQLAPHCRDLPDSVPFEIRNEPCRELTPELWDRFLREAYAIVRETNPESTLVIGPAG